METTGQFPDPTGRTADPARLIRLYLKQRPWASPEELCNWLQKRGIRVSQDVVNSLLAAMKTG